MGGRGRSRRSRLCGRPLRGSLAARVVPDVPTFAVDDGFRYRVREGQHVSVGTLVRVPLGGRRVRGFVVDVAAGSPAGLKEIRSVSGDLPVFDERLLETLRWAALHYVTPLAGLLGKSAPPNLPRRTGGGAPWPAVPDTEGSPLREWAGKAAAGRHVPASYLLADGQWPRHLRGVVAPVARAARSTVVVVPTAVEAVRIAGDLEETFGERVIAVTPELNDRQLTAIWLRAATQPGVILVGTHRIAFWPVAATGLAVVIEEGRRGHKDRQTPTVHAREVLKARSRIERFGLLFMGRVPTTEAVAAGMPVIRAPGRTRMWQLVEVVDRNEEPPGSGLLTQRVRTALRHAVARRERAFLFTHRHGYAPAARCVRCRELRRCPGCGSRPDPGPTCRRCGADLAPCAACGGRRFEPLGAGVGRVAEVADRLLGPGLVGGVDDDRPIVVGTERDLVHVSNMDLAVAVDADGLILGTNYRAAEEALRTLVRVADAVPFGRGKRLMVQTSQPGHRVIGALRRGDPLEFLEEENSRRAQLGFPPTGELIVVEVRDAPLPADRLIREAAAAEASVFGPADVGPRRRWLIQGSRLGPVRVRLRPAVQKIRDLGGRVRVDADPLDL